MNKEDDTRYPWTYACDYIRSIPSFDAGCTKLNRSDASRIRQKIAKIIGMDDRQLACLLADAYLAEPEEPTNDEKLASAIRAVFG